MSCSGSSTGAANADFARGAGGGGALGLGTAIARGGVELARTSGVSDGFGETLLCGLGDFSAGDFFFFFPFGDASFAGDFFDFAFAVASGVSLGDGEASDSPLGIFFFFAFGEGDGDFFFLCGDVFAFGDGVGDSSVEWTARALRTGMLFSSSVCCA